MEAANRQTMAEAVELERYRLGRELGMCEVFRADTMQPRAVRLERWVSALASTDAEIYRQLQHYWANDQQPASCT